MDGINLQLKYDYLKQASTLIKEFESAVLAYLETNDFQYLDSAYKKSYILHRTARAVDFQNLRSFYDQLEVLLSFLRSSKKSELINAEFLIDLTDYINNIHTVLTGDINAQFNHQEILEKIKNFIGVNNQKVVQAPETVHLEQLKLKHSEIYELSLELFSLNSSMGAEPPSASLLQSLNYISEKLLTKSQQLNLVNFQKLLDVVKSDLPLYTSNKLSIHSFGSDTKIETKYLSLLKDPLIDLFTQVLRNGDQAQNLQLILKVYDTDRSTHLDFNFEKVFISEEGQVKFEDKFKKLGLSLDFQKDSVSGTSFQIKLNKSFDLFDAYFFEVNQSQYLIEKDFIIDTVELNAENVFKMHNHGFYYLSYGKNIPILSEGLFSSFKDNFQKGILVGHKDETIVLPIDNYGRFQKVVKKFSYSVQFDQNLYKSLAFLSNGKPAFVFNSIGLIQSMQERELNLAKYIECHFESHSVAFKADQVKEIVSSELLSLSHNNDNIYGLINYHGDIVPVYHPQVIGVKEDFEFNNILIFNCEGGHKAMLVDSSISIKNVLVDDVYQGHAFTSAYKNDWIIESYKNDSKEVNVLNPELIFANNYQFKKVA